MRQIFLLLAIAALTGCFGSDPQKTGKEGRPMPQLSMLLTDSITILHTSDIPSNKPVVFFYFSPFCPYCKAQTNNIVENIDKLKDIQFYFVTNYPLAAVKHFNEEHKLTKYPNITTALDSANVVGEYFEIVGVPFMAIYGKNKILNKTFMGKIYSSQIKEVADE
jgi:peroxiredoxin